MASSFSEGGKAVTDIVIPMAQAFAKVIAFVVIFGLLQFVTWILVFPILKLVLRPLIGRRAHARLLGLVLGADWLPLIFLPSQATARPARRLTT